MINSAPKKHKALANSIAYVSYNLIGYVPGPLVYGVITHFTGPESKVGMVVLTYSLIGCIFFICMAYRSSARTKINMQNVVHNVKEYQESESEYNEEQTKRIIKQQNKLLKYSMGGGGDWSMVRDTQRFKQHSFLEDLIGHNTGISPGPNKLNATLHKGIGAGSASRKGSLTGPQMNKRFSDAAAAANRVTGMGSAKRHHKRGLSLFDNENIMNIGLGGQAATNIFQVQQNSFVGKPNRRTKSIFH
jgi:hypothetical protein